MKLEIPEFLIEMSKQMNEQDNRITAEPIWQVRCKRQVTCCDGREDYWVLVDVQNEYHEIYSTKTCDGEYLCEYMKENYPEWVSSWEDSEGDCFCSGNFDVEDYWHELPAGYEEIERIPMQEVEEVVKTCLTESDANWFINRKQHDYPKLYTYVESMVFCPQMIELRNWILSLEGKDAKS